MKKLFLVALFFIATISTVQSQDTRFGLTGGYLNAEAKVDVAGLDVSDNISGFYLGGFADVILNENLHLRPGINYGVAEENSFLFIPVMLQYYIADSGFYFQAGPQATFDFEEDVDDLVNKFGLDLGFGAGYVINSNFFIEAKYNLEITNRLSDDNGYAELDDASLKINTIMVGVGYKF